MRLAGIARKRDGRFRAFVLFDVPRPGRLTLRFEWCEMNGDTQQDKNDSKLKRGEKRMSRKWEREVERNRKKLNRQRQKQGRPLIAGGVNEWTDQFKGRSWFLPVLFVFCSLFFALMSGPTYEFGGLYWFTVIAYLLLAVIYFLRRPYLKVGKSRLATRRFGADKVVSAGEIEEVIAQPGSVSVVLKGKKTRLIFSRFQNLYDIPAMTERLKSFCEHNGIAFRQET